MKIADEKRRKISEQILAIIYASHHKPLFTSKIANEIARDEEFTKKLLFEMKKQNLLIDIKKNPLGENYSKRIRWKLNDTVYEAYKKASDKN